MSLRARGGCAGAPRGGGFCVCVGPNRVSRLRLAARSCVLEMDVLALLLMRVTRRRLGSLGGAPH